MDNNNDVEVPNNNEEVEVPINNEVVEVPNNNEEVEVPNVNNNNNEAAPIVNNNNNNNPSWSERLHNALFQYDVQFAIRCIVIVIVSLSCIGAARHIQPRYTGQATMACSHISGDQTDRGFNITANDKAIDFNVWSFKYQKQSQLSEKSQKSIINAVGNMRLTLSNTKAEEISVSNYWVHTDVDSTFTATVTDSTTTQDVILCALIEVKNAVLLQFTHSIEKIEKMSKVLENDLKVNIAIGTVGVLLAAALLWFKSSNRLGSSISTFLYITGMTIAPAAAAFAKVGFWSHNKSNGRAICIIDGIEISATLYCLESLSWKFQRQQDPPPHDRPDVTHNGWLNISLKIGSILFQIFWALAPTFAAIMLSTASTNTNGLYTNRFFRWGCYTSSSISCFGCLEGCLLSLLRIVVGHYRAEGDRVRDPEDAREKFRVAVSFTAVVSMIIWSVYVVTMVLSSAGCYPSTTYWSNFLPFYTTGFGFVTICHSPQAAHAFSSYSFQSAYHSPKLCAYFFAIFFSAGMTRAVEPNRPPAANRNREDVEMALMAEGAD